MIHNQTRPLAFDPHNALALQNFRDRLAFLDDDRRGRPETTVPTLQGAQKGHGIRNSGRLTQVL